MKINNDRVGVISDLHLGVHSNSPNWHDIALKWAKWQCREFNKHNIADVIFCGDWHHNRNEISVSTLQISADILDIFSEFNIFIVVGNHDIFYKHRVDVNSLSIFKNRQNVHIIDTVQTLTYNNKNITLCPWNTQIDDIPQSDVIFGHFEIETFKMNAFRVCDHGLKVSSLLRKSPLIVSGHFHTRHEKTYQAGTILYVGNPFEMDFGDMDNEKGYYILDLSTLEYEFFINAISPKHKKTTLDNLVKHGNITQEVKDLFKNNIVKLSIDRNISPEDLNYLTAKLNALGPEALQLDYDITQRKEVSHNVDKDLSGIDMLQAIEEFINLIDVSNKARVLNYTIDLYRRCSI
jgi:DNA repair exonuclease SbcCD nuclease subunit